MTSINVEIGSASVRSYKRLSYEFWYAIAELVDNSTQSYFNNRQALDAVFESESHGLQVRVNYDKDNGMLRISDNAMGMSLTELQNALRIANPPEDTSGRSEFGMGLKTSASWLGDVWTVRTSKFGESLEYQITFDVERIASGDLALPVVEIAAPANHHYTVVEIQKMHQKIGGRTLGKVKEYLRSIYRLDTREGVLDLRWGDEPLLYDDNLSLLKGADGTEYRKEFNFEVHGKTVRGWGAILDAGGRPKAGFAIVRRGRLITGQPSAWRPQSLFGQLEGSNDLTNQRLTGEIHLDDFQVSHTKNQILWQNDELDIVEEKLKEEFNDYKFIANNRRKRGSGGPDPQDTDVALDEIKAILTTPDFVDLVDMAEVPAPELVAASLQPLRQNLLSTEPDRTIVVGTVTVKLFMDGSASPNDPYFVGDYQGSSVSVCVNTQHRFWQDNVKDAGDILIYALNCIYDALAEWKCMQRTGEFRPDTVRVIKDGYMRETVVLGS